MNNKAHLRPNDYDKNGDIIPMACKEEKEELISRSALRKAFHERIWYFTKSSWDEANALIDGAPTVEAVPLDFHEKCMDKTVKELLEAKPKGEWKREIIGDKSCVLCSICNLHFDDESNFCPNCGADMRGTTNEKDNL